MDRFDIRETTARDRQPEPDRHVPDRAPERPGHRSNYDPGREKQDITERMNAAVADVGHYRVVAVADIVRERFGGNPFAARKALDQMKADGWVTERTLQGPSGGKYRVLSPTAAGARRARTQGGDWGMDPQQRVWDRSGLSKSRKTWAHDVAIYRAARAWNRHASKSTWSKAVPEGPHRRGTESSEINSRSEDGAFRVAAGRRPTARD